MTLKEFQEFIKKEDRRLRKKFPEADLDKRLLSRMVKLMEECGEFANAVMLYRNDARDAKLKRFKKSSLKDELADVMIVAAMVAETLGIEVNEAINKKIKKINNRYGE